MRVTHRTEGENINSQNIPSRNEEYIAIRSIFDAPPGYELFKADFSQLELRVLAASTDDPVLIRAFRDGLDLHEETAIDLWGEQVRGSKVHRRVGKGYNFALAYGASADKVYEVSQKEGLHLSMDECTRIARTLDRRYPRINEHRKEYHGLILATGESRTLYGRRRVFPGLDRYDRNETNAALREGFNHRIQGTAADLFKLAWLALWRAGLLDDEHRIVNVVHDEFVGYIPKGDYGWCVLAKEVMESVTSWQPFEEWPMYQWSVPLEVEVGIGPNWRDTVPLQDLLTPPAPHVIIP